MPLKAKEIAKHWRVSLRTAQKWQRAKIPVDDDVAMIRWVAGMPAASQAKLTRAFRTRIDELRMAAERKEAGAFVSDPDYLDFKKTAGAESGVEADNLSDLKRNRAFAIFKLQRSQERGDLAGVKDATESLRYISGVIHDEELRAQKLNREIGDTIPRADAERTAAAMSFWLARSTDELVGTISKKISAASAAPLYPEEVRALIEPHFLDAKILAPFRRASQCAAENKLPQWWVNALFGSTAEILENTKSSQPGT